MSIPIHALSQTYPHIYPTILFREEGLIPLPPVPPGETLTMVEIEIEFDSEMVIRFENMTGATGESMWADQVFKWSVWYGTLLPNSETLTHVLDGNSGLRHRFGPHDGQVDYAGTSGFTASANGTGAGSFVVTNPAFLNAWTLDTAPRLHAVELSRVWYDPSTVSGARTDLTCDFEGSLTVTYYW